MVICRIVTVSPAFDRPGADRVGRGRNGGRAFDAAGGRNVTRSAFAARTVQPRNIEFC